MRAAVKRYVLRRPKLRQSWNKYNLYNTAKFAPYLNRDQRTFFQQKWAAKQITRAYHGEHINEKRWNLLFSRRLRSAVELPPEYLAAFDGAEQAAGRGSGRQTDPNDLAAPKPINAHDFSPLEQQRRDQLRRESEAERRGQLAYPHPLHRARAQQDPAGALLARPIAEMTPYMHMAFAPLERRLDIAIFRALFASSPRQARQFCIHGGVRVNGKKMRYGSYMLNPGDMFQVDPNKVLYATGVQKRNLKAIAASPKQESSEAAEEEGEEEGREAKAEGKGEKELVAGETAEERKQQLKTLLASTKAMLDENAELTVSRKKELRHFTKQVRQLLSKVALDDTTDAVEALPQLLNNFSIDEKNQLKEEKTPLDTSESTSTSSKQQQPPQADPFARLSTEYRRKASRLTQASQLSRAEQQALADLLHEEQDNPVDPAKPYATPWRPRPFLPAFAFIPRYLEVNQNVCAAVYLRHPVARKGLAEVPTPFTYEISQLAHNWYLRRR